MIKWIKENIISIEFRFQTFAGRSVASITSDLAYTVEALEAHAANEVKEMIRKTEEAGRLLGQRAKHEEEHMKASKVAQNIRALIG